MGMANIVLLASAFASRHLSVQAIALKLPRVSLVVGGGGRLSNRWTLICTGFGLSLVITGGLDYNVLGTSVGR